MRSCNSLTVLWGIVAAIILASVCYHFTQWDTHINALSWDVYGYYLYLPGIFNFHDLDSYQFTLQHLEQYKIAHSGVYQVSEHDGEMLPTYTIGMALLYLPFYIVGNILAYFTNYAQDGLSAPYQWSIIVGSWVYSLLGLWYLRKVLLALNIRDTVVALVLLAVGIGSNYFHYAAVESGMPHAWVFSLYAVLLYFIVLWHNTPTVRYSIMIGVVSALIALARPSEGILILLFGLYGVGYRYRVLEKIQYYFSHWKRVLLIIASGVAIVSIQVVFWYVTAGKFLHNSYTADGHEFHFLKPHILEGFFSYRKGWLTYSPVMVLSLGGLLVSHKYKQFRWGITAFFIINTYVVLSWHMWWYANSFGMRALVQSYAILAVPMAAFIDKYWANQVMKKCLITFVTIGIALNLFQDWQFVNRILPGDKINKAFYWKSFGKVELDRDLRKYLDLKNRPPGNIERVLLPSFSSESSKIDTTGPSNRYSSKLSFGIEDAAFYSGQWIDVSATINVKSGNYGQYDQAKLVCTTIRDGKNINWVGVRVQDLVSLQDWHTIDYPYQLPTDLRVGDEVRVVLWNQSPDTILVKDLAIYQLE